MHRDSLGTVQTIEPGDVNWMTAGSGIVHSERTPRRKIASPATACMDCRPGLRCRIAQEQGEPSFSHHAAVVAADDIDARRDHATARGNRVRTALAARRRSRRSSISTSEMQAGASFDLPPSTKSAAFTWSSGELRVDGESVPACDTRGARARDRRSAIDATPARRIMLLGGAKIDGDRLIWWNFVASSKALIDAGERALARAAFPPRPRRDRIHSAAGEVALTQVAPRVRLRRNRLPDFAPETDGSRKLLARDRSFSQVNSGSSRPKCP